MDPQTKLRWDPAFLGPLDDEFVPVTGEDRCFAGEETYLSRRKLDAREKLVTAIQPTLDLVLDSDETSAPHRPSDPQPAVFRCLRFRHVVRLLFFRAALVLTDRRVVEIMLRKPDRADTRTCSYSWGQVQDLKFKLGTLTLKPAEGRTQKWKIQERGDRKLLKLLVPKIIEQLVPGDIHAPRPVPLWHCPECGAATPKCPDECFELRDPVQIAGSGGGARPRLSRCGSGVRRSPGPRRVSISSARASCSPHRRGLVPVGAGPEAMASAVLVACDVPLLHQARERPPLDGPRLAAPVRTRTARSGAAPPWSVRSLSLALMAVPPVFTGVLWAALVNIVDRDLDFASNDLGWSGGLDPDEWAVRH